MIGSAEKIRSAAASLVGGAEKGFLPNVAASPEQ